MPWDHSLFIEIYSRDLGHNIVKQFLEPALSEAISYDRITGDFSSAFLVAAARGFGQFFLANGKMRLITNGRFTEQDIEAIKQGTEPTKILERIIDEELFSDERIIDTFQRKHLEALVWLLKNERLEIKVSLIKGPDGYPIPVQNSEGIQHQKIGIITNSGGEKIAFIGGLNESMRAYLCNAEGLQASYSWNEGNLSAIKKMESLFEILWNNRSLYSSTLIFPEASKKKLISKYSTEKIPNLQERSSKTDYKWHHQDKAIDEFMKVQSGILEMATGTGKTKTSLRIAKKLLSENEIKGIIIATKGNDLLEQWYKECISFDFGNFIYFFRHFGTYKQMSSFINCLKSGKISGQIVSYTNLSELIKRDKTLMFDKYLLICDEIHNIGSPANIQNLSGKLGVFKWKIGLSATPEREYDDEGNEFIKKEIGKVFFRFELEDAIKKDILCEFNYIPLCYELDSEDRDRIKKIYSSYSYRRKKGENVSKTELYTKLADVKKTSKAKIPIFKNYLVSNSQILKNCIIFSETKEYAKMLQDIIIRYTIDYHTYYDEDEKINLDLFSKGEFDCLITCKKISEGIDIKSVQNIILFSSSRAKLETIQRVGRCLRKDSDNPNKKANVLDFVNKSDFEVVEGDYEPVDRYRYSWMKELSEVKVEKPW